MLVSAEDLVRWRREGRADILQALVPGHFGQQAFPAKADGTCQHLGMPGHPHDCAVYETRGESCRAVVPGSSQCRAYRRAHWAHEAVPTRRPTG